MHLGESRFLYHSILTHHPRCGHCQRLTPEYKKAASALKGVVKVGAVNADEHQSLGGQYGVKGFPTIKIFGRNKNKPEDYQGSRDAKVCRNVIRLVVLNHT